MVTKKSSLLALVLTVVSFSAFADAGNTIRKWCGGVFYRRFVASARGSVLTNTQYQTGYNCLGQYVGKNYIGKWSSIGSNENKGCSRPQTATFGPKSGTASDIIYSSCYLTTTKSQPYYVYARAENLVSGATVVKQESGRGKAGQMGDYELNPEIFDKLNDKGMSADSVSGLIDLTDDNILVISGLSGELKITEDADYFSTFKIVVIKENMDITEEDALANENAVFQGTYKDVVYSSDITITKGNISYNGLFARNKQISEFRDGEFMGVTLNQLEVKIPIDVKLAEKEALTIMMIADGGFDISSAIVNSYAPQTEKMVVTQNEIETKIYPNPATETISLELFSETDNIPVQISFYDMLGRLIKGLPKNTVREGTNVIDNISVADLPRGINFVKITTAHSSVVKTLVLE